MESIAQIFSLAYNTLVINFFVFLRVGAVMAVLPCFGERSVPERVRLALAFCFTLIVTPAIADNVTFAIEKNEYVLLLVISEVLLGLAMGLTIRFFVIVLQVSGSIAAQSTSLAQIFGSAQVEPLPAIGHFMVIGGLTLAVMTGLHIRVVENLINSYLIFHPGVSPEASIITEWGVQQIGRAFSLAFSISAPFVIASFVYNLALGVINKAMPQLMVAFVGAPAITAGGILLLFISLPIILNFWVSNLNIFLSNPYM